MGSRKLSRHWLAASKHSALTFRVLSHITYLFIFNVKID